MFWLSLLLCDAFLSPEKKLPLYLCYPPQNTHSNPWKDSPKIGIPLSYSLASITWTTSKAWIEKRERRRNLPFFEPLLFAQTLVLSCVPNKLVSCKKNPGKKFARMLREYLGVSRHVPKVRRGEKHLFASRWNVLVVKEKIPSKNWINRIILLKSIGTI